MPKTDKPKRKYERSGKYAKKKIEVSLENHNSEELVGYDASKDKVIYIPGTNVIDHHPEAQSTHVPAHHRIRHFTHLSLASEVKKSEKEK